MRSRLRAGWAGLLAAALGGGCRETVDLSGPRAEHARSRREFEQLAARDPVVSEALAQGGEVVLAIRPALVQDLVREVAARYLDRVVLDLPLGEQVHDSGEVHVGTFLGRFNAGTWTLDVTIHAVHGRLRARTPRVAPATGNTLSIEVPVALEEGHGSATAHFSWQSRSLASLVCHDFDVTRRLEGEVLAHEYPVSGAFQLSAGPETVRADPVFPRREFRIHVDMTPRSWDEVRAAIHEQDQILRCGLALDPDTLLPRLRERLHEGFDVKLPRSLFRPVDLPAAVREVVTIEDRKVDFSVHTRGLAVTPTAVWYSADVSSRRAR